MKLSSFKYDISPDLIAQDRPHKMIRDFDLKRFERGLHIDERGAGSDPKLHG